MVSISPVSIAWCVDLPSLLYLISTEMNRFHHDFHSRGVVRGFLISSRPSHTSQTSREVAVSKLHWFSRTSLWNGCQPSDKCRPGPEGDIIELDNPLLTLNSSR